MHRSFAEDALVHELQFGGDHRRKAHLVENVLLKVDARRDLGEDCDDLAALTSRMDEYMDEFEANGVENLTLDV